MTLNPEKKYLVELYDGTSFKSVEIPLKFNVVLNLVTEIFTTYDLMMLLGEIIACIDDLEDYLIGQVIIAHAAQNLLWRATEYNHAIEAHLPQSEDESMLSIYRKAAAELKKRSHTNSKNPV